MIARTRPSVMAVVILAFSIVWGAPPASTHAQTLETDYLADIAREVPGFGGVYLDPEDEASVVYAYLTDPASADLDLLRQHIVSRWDQLTQHELVPVQGNFDYIELLRWRDRMAPLHRELDGIVLSGIVRQQILLGVDPEHIEQTRPLIENRAAEMGMPDGMLLIEEMELAPLPLPLEVNPSISDRISTYGPFAALIATLVVVAVLMLIKLRARGRLSSRGSGV